MRGRLVYGDAACCFLQTLIMTEVDRYAEQAASAAAGGAAAVAVAASTKARSAHTRGNVAKVRHRLSGVICAVSVLGEPSSKSRKANSKKKMKTRREMKMMLTTSAMMVAPAQSGGEATEKARSTRMLWHSFLIGRLPRR